MYHLAEGTRREPRKFNLRGSRRVTEAEKKPKDRSRFFG